MNLSRSKPFLKTIAALLSMVVHVFTLQAQDSSPVAQEPAAALEGYTASTALEKVFIHTDRETYLTGEWLWLQVYVVRAGDHAPMGMSKVAYVELRDTDNNAVVDLKVKLENGIGHTAVFLPASLNSGNFLLRGYTRWMRNFSPDWFFHKYISVVNPFKPLNQDDETAPAKYDVQFFPEGGNLVVGLESKVAFRAVDQHGRGLNDVRGLLLASGGDTLLTFRPMRFGLGEFYLTPGNQPIEAVIVAGDGRVISRTQLPAAMPSGYVMRVTEEDDATLQIEVKGTNTTLAGISAVVHTRGRNINRLSGAIKGEGVVFTVDRSALPDGITHLTVFDDRQQPIGERLYFKRPERVGLVFAAADKKQYETREKVTVNIDVKAGETASAAVLSLAVRRKDELLPRESMTIDDYLLLTSDLSGNVESPSFYFGAGPDVKKCTDILMLTHGWRRFTWKALGQPQDVRYLPEYRGHLISGMLTAKTTGAPVNNIVTYLSVPGKNFHLRGAKSGRSGELLFELLDFYGPGKIILQNNWTKDSVYSLAVDPPFEPVLSDRYARPRFRLDRSKEEVLLDRSVNMQIDNAYLSDKKASINYPAWDSMAFYRKPDEQYFLDDYTRFGVMEEVMREYVPGVLVRKRQKSFYFLVINDNQQGVFSENPMVLLDGVPVFDIDQIMAYDPLQVEKLDVVTNRYFYGALSFSGLVSYQSYTGDLPGFTVDDRALVQAYDGLAWRREFFSPVYETDEQKGSRVPDTRNVLYWKPEIYTGADGKALVSFFTGDVPGTYEVDVQGLTLQGSPGSARLELVVEAGTED